MRSLNMALHTAAVALQETPTGLRSEVMTRLQSLKQDYNADAEGPWLILRVRGTVAQLVAKSDDPETACMRAELAKGRHVGPPADYIVKQGKPPRGGRPE